MKIQLLGMSPSEIQTICLEEGLAKFTAKQITDWLYKKRVRSIDEMTNLSKVAREKLNAKYEVGVIAPAEVFTSVDGTKKYLFPIGEDSKMIEAVMIPDGDRATLCVSSQVGCKMGCKFCMTGRQGFHGDLTVAQILSQYISVEESEKLTNTVFMGMGEPLDNWSSVHKALEVLTADWGFAWSPKRITLSSIGVLPTLKEFLDKTRCHLAISIHNPFPAERQMIMPMQKGYNIEDIVSLIKQYDFTGQRRVSFEYIMFAGVNDTKRHADGLIRLLKGLECRINLIRFHQIPDSELKGTPDELILPFQQRLNNGGITTTIRASRGEDILAACGLLAGKHLKG